LRFLSLAILRLPGAALLLRVAWIARLRTPLQHTNSKLRNVTALPVLRKPAVLTFECVRHKAQWSKPWTFYFVAAGYDAFSALSAMWATWSCKCLSLVSCGVCELVWLRKLGSGLPHGEGRRRSRSERRSSRRTWACYPVMEGERVLATCVMGMVEIPFCFHGHAIIARVLRLREGFASRSIHSAPG
jgi:hypothetical protein